MRHATPVRPALCAFLILAGLGATAPSANAATATIDTSVEHQTIRGFGGATVFQPPGLPESLSDPEMDTLFLNGPGQLGFNILRIRVAEDDAWRAVELSHAHRAWWRGADVIATPWSPPAAMKSNNSLIGGYLLPGNYAAYATYLDDFATYMAANDAPLYAISVQNEPDIAVTYESCDWTPQQMLDFCRNHANAITATRLIAPESFQFRRNMSDPILNDRFATENVEIIGGHIYGGGLADYPFARAKDKEVWMTEHLDSTEVTPGSHTVPWLNTLAVAKEMHDCFATANFNAYIWWYLKRFYGPLGEDSVVTKRGWIMAQFSKFIRPGFVRIDATANPTAGVYVSAYKKDTLVIVAVNTGNLAVVQNFTVAGSAVNTVDSWTTSQTVDLQAQAPIAVNAGSFAATLPAQSVTTFVGNLIYSPPSITRPPQDRVFPPGGTIVLDVAATGERLTYEWRKDGTKIDGATAERLTITESELSDTGSYTVTVSNSGGSVTGAAANLTVAASADPGRLVNISTRSLVGAGENVQIAGFVIAGSAPKQVLIRAAGPELAGDPYNIPAVLEDPVIELHDGSGAIIAGNNDWDPSLEATFAAAGAFAWTPGSKSAALAMQLDPGAYTAVVRGADGGAGVAIAEVYDITPGVGASKLVNISTRSQVGIDDDVQIGGFYITGSTAKTVVIRASGPALNASFSYNGVVADPVIELRDSGGALIASNDDWEPYRGPRFVGYFLPIDPYFKRTGWITSVGEHFKAVGAFGWFSGSRDAAIVTSLDPGGYTVTVRGKNGGTGIALVEIYGEN